MISLHLRYHSLLHLKDLQFFYLLHIVDVSDLVHFLFQFFDGVVELIQFEIALEFALFLLLERLPLAFSHQLVVAARDCD
jgi:hypothetical protein